MRYYRNYNSVGAWGFIFACLGAVFCWLPYFGGLFWLIGAVLSCIGLCYPRNGLAWWGFWISLLWIVCYFCFGINYGTYNYLTVYPLYIW